MKRTPSLFRIVQVDYLASLGVIFPVVLWGFVLATRWLDPDATSFFLLIAPAVSVAGLGLLVWRLWSIRSLFSSGTEVPGVVSGIGFFRGRGRVEYVYTYQGRKYLGRNAVQSTRVTRSLAQGQEVIVLIDPLRPKRAFLRELYL